MTRGSLVALAFCAACGHSAPSKAPDAARPPAAAAEPEPVTIVVEKRCVLPPPLKIETITQLDYKNCKPPAVICLDLKNAATLIERHATLWQWIQEAQARCGEPPKRE